MNFLLFRAMSDTKPAPAPVAGPEDAKTGQPAKSDNADDLNALEKVKLKVAPTVKSSSVVLILLHAALFITGCATLNNCPLNAMIPIYLIVAGIIGIVVSVIPRTKSQNWYVAMVMATMCDLLWQILCTYWVYKEYQPNYDSLAGEYCNRTAYLFAFWTITIKYVLLIVTLLLISCFLLMRNDFKN